MRRDRSYSAAAEGLILGTLIFAAVLWLGSVFLQGWLYNDLARKLPVRALVGGREVRIE